MPHPDGWLGASGVPDDLRARLLTPDVMAEPILYLCPPSSNGVTDARIVATEFGEWLQQRRQTEAGAVQDSNNPAE